jgi:transcriptional regulator
MHPDATFAWDNEAAMRAFVAETAFAHLFVSGPAGAGVAHVPLLVTRDGTGAAALQFHLPRRNRVAPLIAGATLIASIAGPDAYVSPGWYASTNQVPTWNYVAVEAEGRATPMDQSALIAHLDALSAVHETRFAYRPAWTRAKMADGRFEAMLPAIVGYELAVSEWRGTRKLSQNKPAADRAGVVAGFTQIGNVAMADLVAHAQS